MCYIAYVKGGFNMDAFKDLASGGDATSMFLLGCLGLFGAFLILGVFWGFIRGGKRATLRLITVVIAMVLALICTPMFTGAGFASFGGMATDMASNMAEEQGIAVTTELMASITSIVLGLVNILVFIVMYFVMKWITWIVYAVLAHIFAPKHNKHTGEKHKKYRLVGVGVGIVTGIVFFAFFMIPVNGILQGFDEVASYKASTARTTRSTTEGIAGQLENAQLEVIEINKSIKKNAYATVTKFSGMQMLGKWGLGYLMTTGDVHLRDEIIRIGQVAVVDGAGVIAKFITVNDENDGDIMATMNSLDDYDIERLANILDVVTNTNGVGGVMRGVVNAFFGEQLDMVKGYVDEIDEQFTGAIRTEVENMRSKVDGYKSQLDGLLAELESYNATDILDSTDANDYVNNFLDFLLAGGDFDQFREMLGQFAPDLTEQLGGLNSTITDLQSSVAQIRTKIETIKTQIDDLFAKIDEALAIVDVLKANVTEILEQLQQSPKNAKIEWQKPLEEIQKAFKFFGNLNIDGFDIFS